jgi:hypothetical protein
MQRDRKREGLRVCRAARLVGATVQEYRGLEAGVRFPTSKDVGPDLQAVRVAARLGDGVATRG